MIERLKPCPCGSGNRFKNCCGQITEASAEHKVSLPERVLTDDEVTEKKPSGHTFQDKSQIEITSIQKTKRGVMSMFFPLFQTATGAWHIQSILVASSWLFSSIVTGIFIFSQLAANRAERLSTFENEKIKGIELQDARSKIVELEGKAKEIPALQSTINEQIKKLNEVDNRNKARSISDDQRSKIIFNLKGAPKSPIQLLYSSSDPEINSFGEQIYKLLSLSGYSIKPIRAAVTGAAPGITLAVKDCNNPPQGAIELISALKEYGISCNGTDGHANINEILISVGAKPI